METTSVDPAPTAPPEPYEPWRLSKPVRQGPLIRPRVLIVGLAGAVAAGLLTAGAVVLWEDGGDGGRPDEARQAGALFARDASARADGRDQGLVGAASVGSTVVAAGVEQDPRASRGRFLVSTDDGRSFRLAEVKAADGAEPGPDESPQFVAGSSRGWVAVGTAPDGIAVWSSRDGRAWRRQPVEAGRPLGGGNRVNQVIGTGTGFLAVGASTTKGDFKDAAPVLWMSADGRHWEKLTGDRLDLGDLGKGTLELTHAASSGARLLLQGTYIAKPGDAKSPAARRTWYSDDGGWTWEDAKVPAPPGTSGLTIGGGQAGFLAVREIRKGSDVHGQAFTSADGKSWDKAGELKTGGYQRVRRLLGTSGGYVAVLRGKSGAVVLRSDDGKSWESAGSAPIDAKHAVFETAATPGATVIVGRDFTGEDTDATLAVRDAKGTEVPADPAKIPGFESPDRTVIAVATGAGRTVAAGSTDGDAALWTSGDGRAWTRAQGQGDALAGTGRRRLFGLAYGGKGWLAIGYGHQRRPLVVTSGDGARWKAVDAGSAFKPSQGTAVLATAAGPAGYAIVGIDGPSAAAWSSSDLGSWKRAKGAGRDDLDAKQGSNQVMHTVAGGGFGFVAAGGRLDPAVRNAPRLRPVVWTSSDGGAWKLRQLALPPGLTEGSLQHVVAKGNTLVALGDGRKGAARTTLAYLSTDGGTSWQEAPLKATADTVFTAATAVPGGFTVAGTTGRPGSADVVLWTSADGRTWRSESPRKAVLGARGDQQITGLATIGSALLGVGLTADQRGEQPILYRKPLP